MCACTGLLHPCYKMRIGFWVCGFKSVDDSHIGAISCSSPFTMIMSFVLEWKSCSHIKAHWGPWEINMLGQTQRKKIPEMALGILKVENVAPSEREQGQIWMLKFLHFLPQVHFVCFLSFLFYITSFLNQLFYILSSLKSFVYVSLTHMDWLLRFKTFSVFLYS